MTPSLFLSLLLASGAQGGALCDLGKADAAFEQKQPQKALELYEAALKACKGEERLSALYRAAESKALLFRYAEASQGLAAESLPSDPLWRARLLILEAELARENLKQYGFAAPEDEEAAGDEGAEAPAKPKDLTRRTREEWQAEVSESFRGLWPPRDTLRSRPLREEAYFVDIKNADLDLAPDLWAFAVLRWTEYLAAEAPAAKTLPDPAPLVAPDYTRRFDPKDPPGLQTAALLEDGRGELGKLARLMLPFERSHLFAPPKIDLRAEALKTLKNWREAFSQTRAKAEAALRAATLSRDLGRQDEAASICRDAEDRWPKLAPTRECAKLRAQIELPELQLSPRFAPPPGKGALEVRARNIPRVYLRLYRVTESELAELHARSGGGARSDWSHLRQIGDRALGALLARRPDHGWSVELKPGNPHEWAQAQADPPPLDDSIYVAAACGDDACAPGRSLVAGAVINVTRLLLVGSAGPMGAESLFVPEPGDRSALEAPVFHLYALNAQTGRPAARARVDAWRGLGGRPERISLTADEQGMTQASVRLARAYGDSTSASLDPLARSGEAVAYWAGPAWFGHNSPAPVELRLETDRPIYRPGQEVRVKVTALLRLPRGYKTYDRDASVTLTANDPNGQTLHTSTIKLNAFGSGSARFNIPTGRLLGGYSIGAQLSDFGHGFHGGAQFQVEEYKRPEFEVLVNESTGAWKFGQRAVVAGEARYYFGGPVPDAPVSYRVTRQRYVPWFCWFWRGFGGGASTVASGQAKTDASGAFSFAFTPEPENPGDAYPARFEVTAEARDAGGRTITATRSFAAGAKAYLFEISPASGFFDAGEQASIPVRLRNLNERAVAGRGRWTLYRLAGAPRDEDPGMLWAGQFPETPSLEQLYRDVPNGETVRTGKLAFSEDKAAAAALGELPEGAYRFSVQTDDPWGGTVEQSIVLLAAGKGVFGLALPAVALPEHASYVAGENARFLIGSSLVTGTVFVEIWGGQYLLERRALPGGVRVLTVPVRADHKGGFTIRWFGAKDFRVRSGQVRVEVPFNDKELRVRLSLPKAVKPGARTRGALAVHDYRGKPVDAEALVRVYDRSLEYYSGPTSGWVSGLYPPRGGAPGAQGSIWPPYAMMIPIRAGAIERMLQLFREATIRLEPPALRLNRSRAYGRNYARMKGAMRMEEGMALEMDMMSDMGGGPPMAKMASSAPAPAMQAMSEQKAMKPGGPPSEPAVAVRTDFSETAYFEPQLPVKAGKGRFSFKAPERLTDWRATTALVTRDVKHGAAESTFATRKELMVRVDMPRFFREGDEGRISAMVHNETERELSGEVSLSAEEEGKRGETRLGLADLAKPFAVKPHAVAALVWPLKAPRGTGSFKIRAIARSGELVDAEERDLPILPSRERLIESTLAALDGKTRKALELPTFKEPDPTRENESMTLQIDPQLALSVLNSLPFLMRYPYECTEQVLHRYVPLAIVNAFYRKNPKLAEAVRKIPKRGTLTPAWDRKDPRRLMSLMETPWEEASKGAKAHWPIIDLFEPKVVDEQKADALATLTAYQLGDGGFPWFPGGRADPYMTLLVLGGFAEAMRYDVAAPEEVTRRALLYAYNEIPRHLKADPSEVSLVLLGAWVVTSYPKSYSAAAKGWVQAKVWADFADKHGEALTPMGRALAAQVYLRLGERAKAESYLDRAMDGAREDPIAGVYWQPEKLSWLWYNDNVETHAFILRSLLTVRPKDRRIPGMVQWLLFNRKGNEWKSTKASAAAIYSLLDVMRARGALDKGDRYDVAWGERKESAEVGALDWLSEPLRYTLAGPAVTPADGKAVITKEGPGLAFASLTWIYSTDKLPAASGAGMLQVERKFFRRVEKPGEERGKFRLEALKSGDAVAVGDTIEVQLVVSARSQFEYVHLKDPRGAGFEAEALTSGWRWDQLGRYEEPRDSLTNFFMGWLPHGEYALRYRVRPTTPGRYRIGAAVLQSMYAPEMAAHSAGFELSVRE